LAINHTVVNAGLLEGRAQAAVSLLLVRVRTGQIEAGEQDQVERPRPYLRQQRVVTDVQIGQMAREFKRKAGFARGRGAEDGDFHGHATAAAYLLT